MPKRRENISSHHFVATMHLRRPTTTSTMHKLCLFVIQILLVGVASSSNATCHTLSSLLPKVVSFPADAAYSSSEASYAYVQQQVQRPSCIVKPSNAAEVSSAIKALGNSTSAFAIRSGGHATNSGFSNINGGVTLDLTSLDDVDIFQDGAHVIASVGTGAAWGDVYEVLDTHGRSLNGGRASGVGVGGLISGGGIGFFALQHGFACDAVINMEVVLANGEIVNANSTSHLDLFLALKGGQNNFGIVTRWDIETIPQGMLWGGNIVYNYSTNLDQLDAFTNWKSPENFDPRSSVEQSHVYAGSVDQWIISSAIFYAEPVSDPENLKNFTKIGSQLSNSIRISNVTDFANEVQSQSTPNLYTIFASITFRISPKILAKVENLWQTSVKAISQVATITSSLTLQSIPAPPSAPERWNSLGFDHASKPQEYLVLLLITNFWEHPDEGFDVEKGTQVFVDNVIRATKDEGLARDFVYENYAAAGFQRPLESTGSLGFFRKVASTYDPGQMFQKQVLGGWKLY